MLELAILIPTGIFANMWKLFDVFIQSVAVKNDLKRTDVEMNESKIELHEAIVEKIS